MDLFLTLFGTFLLFRNPFGTFLWSQKIPSKGFWDLYRHNLVPFHTLCLYLGADGDGGFDVDMGKYNLAMEAFDKCESDGNPGLTWAEIEACENHFCSILAIECPTQEDFEMMDTNGDGVLTLEEHMESNLNAVGGFGGRSNMI